ncbi:MAG: 6-hydroxymethylpterin diphosphokinase MptE-like protein [Burkholderiaceae bacterium]
MSLRLQRLRDRHRGQRCVIVANGPSLNRMDWALLRGEICIGLNKIFLGLETFGFYPRYYVAVNPNVVCQSRREIHALNCPRFIAARAARAAALAEDALTYVIDTDRPPARFSADLTQGMHEGWTVTHAALQVAYHLGFSTVVLVGLDHRYAFRGAPNETQTLVGADPNHFSDKYFGYGQTWDNPDLAQSEVSYRIALDAFQRDGREVVDATVEGGCPIFPKVDYRRYFHRGGALSPAL